MAYIPPSSFAAIEAPMARQGVQYAPGSTSGGLVTGSDTFGSVAQAAGGASKTLVGLAFANKKKKLARKQKKIEAAYRKHQFQESELGSLEDEASTLRDYDEQMPGVLSDISARGGAESSHRKEVETREKFRRDQRLDAIRRNRALLRHGYEAGEKIRAIQEKMEKIDRTEAIIAASIDTVISVASIVCDKRLKREFREVDTVEILASVMSLPLKTWRYEWEGKQVRHLGPMSQDWHRLLRLGHDTGKVDVVDAFGVALASIQAQQDIISRLSAEIDGLRDNVRDLAALVLEGRG